MVYTTYQNQLLENGRKIADFMDADKAKFAANALNSEVNFSKDLKTVRSKGSSFGSKPGDFNDHTETTDQCHCDFPERAG